MNGGFGRNRGPADIDGCLTELGYTFLVVCVIAVIATLLMWFFSWPDDICAKWDKIKVIEKTQAQQEILVDKWVCSQYAPSPLESPFNRVIDRVFGK